MHPKDSLSSKSLKWYVFHFRRKLLDNLTKKSPTWSPYYSRHRASQMCETNQWPPEGSISNLPPFIWVRYHSSLKTFCRLTKCSNPEPCACLMISEDFTLQIDEFFFSIQERKSIIQDFPSKAFYWFTTLLKIWTEIHFRDFRFIKSLDFSVTNSEKW